MASSGASSYDNQIFMKTILLDLFSSQLPRSIGNGIKPGIDVKGRN